MNLPTETTITLSGQDLQIIYAALDEIPTKLGRMVYNRISAQVEAQLEAHRKQTEESAARLEEDRRSNIIAEYVAGREKLVSDP